MPHPEKGTSDSTGEMDEDIHPREWLYIDAASNTQRGPATLSMLTKMLEKGIGVTGSTLAWKTGMENWKAMSEVRTTTMMKAVFSLSTDIKTTESPQPFFATYSR